MIEILSRIKLIQLRELGQNRKISKYYKMKKAELIDAIVTWNEQKFFIGKTKLLRPSFNNVKNTGIYF